MASHLCVIPSRQRGPRRRTLPRPWLLFMLVASPLCLDAAARTDREKLHDPSLEYSAFDRDGDSGEQGDDDEYEYAYNDESAEATIIPGAESDRDERTSENGYEHKQFNDENTTILPEVYDPDDTDPPHGTTPQEETAERSFVRSIDASASSSQPNHSKKSAWITHGTLGALSFGLLVPAAVSSALFRDLLPAYWIYIHVFLNVATFSLILLAVGLAFAAMHSLGEANEGRSKELHHIVGLGLTLLLAFQAANGFLRPPREFHADDEDEEEDSARGAMHDSESRGQRGLSPRRMWRWIHRTTGVAVLAAGTWQIRSGLEIFARKFGTADWGAVYLGYMGWLVFVVGGGKLWMMFRERRREGKNPWNAEDELFDTDALSHGLDEN